MKLPGIHTDLVLMDVPKTDALHLLPQHLAGRKLRRRPRRPVAELWMRADLLHPLRQLIGIFCIDPWKDTALFHTLPPSLHTTPQIKQGPS